MIEKYKWYTRHWTKRYKKLENKCWHLYACGGLVARYATLTWESLRTKVFCTLRLKDYFFPLDLVWDRMGTILSNGLALHFCLFSMAREACPCALFRAPSPISTTFPMELLSVFSYMSICFVHEWTWYLACRSEQSWGSLLARWLALLMVRNTAHWCFIPNSISNTSSSRTDGKCWVKVTALLSLMPPEHFVSVLLSHCFFFKFVFSRTYIWSKCLGLWYLCLWFSWIIPLRFGI